MKYLAMITGGLIVSGIAFYLNLQTLNKASTAQETVSYLALRADLDKEALAPGERIEANQLVSLRVPAQGDTLTDIGFADTPAMRQFVSLRALSETVPRGRVLTRDMFATASETRLDQQISLGMRAMAISVSAETSIDGQIAPGNRVDLVGVLNAFSSDGAQVILSDIKVIAVGDSFSFERWVADGRRPYSTVTVEVAPDEALSLLEAKERLASPISLILRNQCDTLAEDVIGCNTE